jgi:hypothetical protein
MCNLCNIKWIRAYEQVNYFEQLNGVLEWKCKKKKKNFSKSINPKIVVTKHKKIITCEQRLQPALFTKED